MEKYNTFLYKLIERFTKVISSIKIAKEQNVLTPDDKFRIKSILTKEPVIILTATESHLSSYLVKVLTFFKTGEKAVYSHAVMSYYDYEDDTFILIESTNSGVHISSFDEVMKCSNICVLEIKHDKEKDIDGINIILKNQLGKKYDNLFDVHDDSRLSCVEVVYHALKPFDFEKTYPSLYTMIKTENNLTPQMFKDCGDFKILFEK